MYLNIYSNTFLCTNATRAKKFGLTKYISNFGVLGTLKITCNSWNWKLVVFMLSHKIFDKVNRHLYLTNKVRSLNCKGVAAKTIHLILGCSIRYI